MIPKKEMLDSVQNQLGSFTATERAFATAILNVVEDKIVDEVIRITFVRNRNRFERMAENFPMIPTAEKNEQILKFIDTIRKEVKGDA